MLNSVKYTRTNLQCLGTFDFKHYFLPSP